MNTVKAFTAGNTDSGWTRSVVDFPIDALGDGDVLVRVDYSGINFKDGLASSATGRVARLDPLVPGVDLAGVVEESGDPAFTPGQAVIVHGYDLGVAHHGGFAEMARVPGEWVVPMPAGLDSRTAMEILEILRGLNRDGVTVVLVTHDHEVGAAAERIVHIRDGTTDDGLA